MTFNYTQLVAVPRRTILYEKSETDNHLHLTSFSKMRVDLAAQVKFPYSSHFTHIPPPPPPPNTHNIVIHVHMHMFVFTQHSINHSPPLLICPLEYPYFRS